MKLVIFSLLFALACRVAGTPDVLQPIAPLDASLATFRVNIRILTEEGIENAGSGTAWVVFNEDGQSVLITAGHVCTNDSDQLQAYTLTAPNGQTFLVAHAIAHPSYDLCALFAVDVVGPALPLATRAPYYDEPVMAVGAPNGVYGCTGGSSVDACGMAPISRGYYAGGNLVSMPMFGGNSGSAVFTSSGVIGVLIEGYRTFPHLSFIEPRAHLIEFLDSI